MKKRIFIAGHKGMVGSAIVRQLESDDDVDIVIRSREQLNLLSQKDVAHFFETEAIDQVYLAAAKVGGIHANNTYPADFIYENLIIQANVIHEAYKSGVQKLLFLGSSCIYPKHAPQPMSEEALLEGKLEPTNEPYAIAKISGIKLCESYNRQYGLDYRSVMPTNLYGQNDNFHSENAHVIPALMRRMHEAKVNGDSEMIVWGSGKPMREFLHVDDMASASIHVMNIDKADYQKQTLPMQSHINVGTGKDCSIDELVRLMAQIVGFQGRLHFDDSKPDGAPRKLLDVTRLENLGWKSEISLEKGLSMTYSWYMQNLSSCRK